MAQPARKVVICGAGFLGSNIARAFLSGPSNVGVQLTSRSPKKLYDAIAQDNGHAGRLLPPVSADITSPSTLPAAFKDASVVVSLVGIMHGAPADFERVQWRGAENVARAAREAGAKLVHFSAIGADANSHIPYARTKALGEQAVFEQCPDATVIRPSLVFGPGDEFFARFAKLASLLPFLPVFGGGVARFQPVYAGDIARAVELVARKDNEIQQAVAGKIIEAGGPEVSTYRELMEMVLKYSNRWRPIISLPFAAGIAQGFVLEKLPVNLFTVTQAQVEQLKSDNIVNPTPPANHASFKDLLEKHSSGLTSVHTILPTYLGSK